MQEKWNHKCLFQANREQLAFHFMAAGVNRVIPTPLMLWVKVGNRCREYPTPCRLHQRGLYCSKWPCYQCLSSSPSEAGLSSACSNHVDLLVTALSFWINCGLVQNPGDSSSLKKKKKSFLFWLLGVYRVWWVGFFSSLVIAASGLRKDCGVCSHFNKYSIKMLRCVDFLVSW